MENNRCLGKTKKGSPCKNRAVEGSYCRLHTKSQSQQREGEDIEATQAAPSVEASSADSVLQQVKNKPLEPEIIVNNIGASGDASESTEKVQAQNSAATSKTIDMLVIAGTKVVDLMDAAIVSMPDIMDSLFKYSAAKMLAPEFTNKMQHAATDRIRKKLSKWQEDFMNIGSDPQKLDKLNEQILQLENMVVTVLTSSGRYIPMPLKEELKAALAELKKFSRVSG